MAFPNYLDKNFKEDAELDKLEPLSGYDNALHQEQAADLSSNGAKNTQKFFDYMALHILIPCINALNRAVLALRGNTSTSLASLEQKFTKLSGNTSTSVEALEKRMDTVEEVSVVSTTKVENATSLAKAAAENVMQKDRAASVLDVVKKTPLYFGTGTTEEIEAALDFAPGETLYFDESDTSFEDAIAKVDDMERKLDNKAPAGCGYGDPMAFYSNEDNTFEATLTAIFNGMANTSAKQIQFYDKEGLIGNKFIGTLWRYTGDYGVLEAVNYLGAKVLKCYYGGVWQPWQWENPPLEFGVEYATTRRQGGKIVYVKRIDFGELPDSGNKTVLYIKDSENAAGGSVVGFQGFCTNDGTSYDIFPFVTSEGVLRAKVRFTEWNISVAAITDSSANTAEFTVWYTKR